MEDIVLQTQSISKRYGTDYALEDVSISLLQGHIYGFIGANGAGKTTLLRIITGLTFPTSGELMLFGKESSSELRMARKHIGSIIESPAFYPNYTAVKNLELQRILVGNPDKDMVRKNLQMVGLEDSGNKKVKDFSLGMKQRLGIALSLMGNPKILILDEPINGLDPKGISELRIILKKLNSDRKITILISSHILNELYLLATDYIIIDKGRIIEAQTHEELDAKCQKYVSIRMSDVSMGVTVIEKELKTSKFKVMEDGTVHLYEYLNDIPTIAKALSKHEILVTHIALSEQTLEEYYLTLTGGGRYA